MGTRPRRAPRRAPRSSAPRRGRATGSSPARSRSRGRPPPPAHTPRRSLAPSARGSPAGPGTNAAAGDRAATAAPPTAGRRAAGWPRAPRAPTPPAAPPGARGEGPRPSLHRPQRLLADLAPELGAQRDHLGRLHRPREFHRELNHRLDPSRARRHDGDARRQEQRLVQAVGHEDDGLARAPPYVEQPLAHEHARLLVEGAERLVHQEDPRVDGQRAPDGHALLHPTRELARVALPEAAQPQRAEQLGGRPAPALGRDALQLEPELDVLERRTPWKEPGVLEHGGDPARVRARHRLAGDQQPPAVRRHEAAEHAEERRLAAAGGADQRAELALGDRERDVVEGVDRTRARDVALGDGLDGDQRATRGGHESWRISRAMTMRWTSDVPSP